MADRYVFADEAGNFDFSLDLGASRFFILATVAMDHCAVGRDLLELRRDLAWRGVSLDTVPHATEDHVPPTAIVWAWTNPGGNVIHMQESICGGLEAKPGDDPSFARSLSTLIHEAAHARGVRSEPCAELWEDLVVYEVLERYYRIPMFSKLSELVGWQIYSSKPRPPADACLYEVH